MAAATPGRGALVYRAGELTVDVGSHTVTGPDGRSLRLSWKSWEALRLLVTGEGDVIERNDLIRGIWPDVSVDESSLNQCISQLRRELGNHAALIETVPRRGYRLSVRPEPLAVATAEPELPKPESATPRSRPWKWAVSVTFALVLAAGSVWFFLALSHRREASRLAQEGIALVRTQSTDQFPQGLALLRRADALVPDSALTTAWLAEAAARSTEGFPGHVVNLSERAVDLDGRCGECRGVLGWLLMTRGWRWERAGEQLRRAVELEPENARLRLWLAQYMAARRDFPNAIREIETAGRLAPGDGGVMTMRAGILYLAGQYEPSAKVALEAASTQPGNPAPWDWLSRVHVQRRDFRNAIASRVRQVRNAAGFSSDWEEKTISTYNALLEASGPVAVADEFLRRSDNAEQPATFSYDRAAWSLWAGRREEALKELSAAVESRAFHVIYMAADPAFAPLRSDSRFRELVRRAGLTVIP